MTGNYRRAAAEFQKNVWAWGLNCFGVAKCFGHRERNHRFLEEAVELVQALDCSREEAHALVDMVFDKPKGEIHNEVGGVLVCLAMLCEAHGTDMLSDGFVELDRINGRIPEIQAKSLAKPRFEGIEMQSTAKRKPT